MNQVEAIQSNLKLSLKVVQDYAFLLDMYVVDFFVDNHWSKLPKSWQEALDRITPIELGDMLSGNPVPHVIPLSLLALIRTAQVLSIPRKVQPQSKNQCKCESEKSIDSVKLEKLLIKHVKKKKRAEIEVIGTSVCQVAQRAGVNSVVDAGAGLGHLVRTLAFSHRLYAVGLDTDEQLTETASKLDCEIKYSISKHLSTEQLERIPKPVHLNRTVTKPEDLTNVADGEFVLVGLHPCGDLGPQLLMAATSAPKARGVLLASCCYMKMQKGYPMSLYTRNLPHELSYAAREVACHALEEYVERLRNGDYHYLKIHCARALLEKVLVEHDPKLRHSAVRSVKHHQDMTFETYYKVAASKIQDAPPPPASLPEESQWSRVVSLYSLRVALAPLVETVILLDRALYLIQHGWQVRISARLCPRVSPRNLLLEGTLPDSVEEEKM